MTRADKSLAAAGAAARGGIRENGGPRGEFAAFRAQAKNVAVGKLSAAQAALCANRLAGVMRRKRPTYF